MKEPRLYAVGDVHGDADRLKALLREAGLIDAEGNWSGGTSALVFTGDLTDRGSEGLAVIDLVMDLQDAAAAAGGWVESLMGNHDALILARAFEWRGQSADPDCRDLFILNGGRDVEAKALAEDDEAFTWMQDRPLMLRVGTTLFQHADGMAFYASFGDDVDSVNKSGAELAATAPGAWRIFYEMTDARDWDVARLRANARVLAAFEDHLERFGAARVVHGHTRHTDPQPLRTFRNRAINIDGSLSAGYRRTSNRGFVADFGPLETPLSSGGERQG